MINLLEIYDKLADDVDLDHCSRQYLISRINNEGVKFATVTLPKFAKAVLEGIEMGRLCPPSRLSEFSWKAGLPEFLRGYLMDIFDNKGYLLSQPCPIALMVIRQICEYVYKLVFEWTGDKPDFFEDAEAIANQEKFLECEREIGPGISDHVFAEEMRRFIARTYSFPKLDLILNNYKPRNTSGTFAGNVPDYYAYKSSVGVAQAYLNNNAVKAVSGCLRATSHSELGPALDKDTSSFVEVVISTDSQGKTHIRTERHAYSELLFVPKDSRGPRVIVREPLHNLKMQMSFFDCVTDCLERQSEGRINFRDQQVNRSLAAEASITGDMATLDLKEASDRVSAARSRFITRGTSLRWFIDQRTKFVKLKDGRFHKLNKLAGMGSGLTFPMLALTAHTACVVQIVREGLASEINARMYTYVYGDDLIVPTRWVDAAKRGLALAGLTVNDKKSFYRVRARRPCEPTFRGYFRESCGGDYLHGNDVTPVRLKLSSANLIHSKKSRTLVLNPDRPAFAAFALQLERHCRELVRAGHKETANYFYRLLEKQLGKLPAVAGNSTYLGRYQTIAPNYDTDATGLHKPVRAICVSPRKETHDDIDTYYLIGQKLRPSVRHWDDYLSGVGQSSVEGEVTVPRSFVLRRTRVSAFALMG